MRWKAPSSLQAQPCNGCATGLKIIGSAPETGKLADQADPSQNVYLVPAFVGLGAPHWDAEARGAIYGLTRNTGPAEFARAALESVAYQTRDLLDAMRKDWKSSGTKTVLRVDGGMVASDWTMQRLADILDAPVDRPDDSRDDSTRSRMACRVESRYLAEPAANFPRPGNATCNSHRRWTTKPARRRLRVGGRGERTLSN